MTERERRLCYWLAHRIPPMAAADIAGYTLEDAAEAAKFLKTTEAQEQIGLEKEMQAEEFKRLAKAAEFSKAEIEAFNEKDNNPGKTVLCPRCGTELFIEEHGSGYSIKCQTEGCFCGNVRGL